MNDAIKFYIDQLDTLEDEKLGVSVQIRDLYSSAKEAGHDANAIRIALKLFRMDKAKRERLEQTQHMADQYCLAIGI